MATSSRPYCNPPSPIENLLFAPSLLVVKLADGRLVGVNG